MRSTAHPPRTKPPHHRGGFFVSPPGGSGSGIQWVTFRDAHSHPFVFGNPNFGALQKNRLVCFTTPLYTRTVKKLNESPSMCFFISGSSSGSLSSTLIHSAIVITSQRLFCRLAGQVAIIGGVCLNTAIGIIYSRLNLVHQNDINLRAAIDFRRDQCNTP